MANILHEIYQHKLVEVRNRKKIKDLRQICQELKCLEKTPANRNFYQQLQHKNLNQETALICEIKKGSPAKGLIREDFDAIKIAQQYQNANATCLSVLTDQKFFYSTDQFLIQARSASTLPILRKDFMVDPYQIYEAKMLGADCILLIVAMLDDAKLQELEQVAIDLNLSVLVEVHDQEELLRANKLKSKLLGINSRNLKTLEVNLQNIIELAKQVDKSYTLVAESGINSLADLKKLKQAGINCFLIGEYFMRQNNIAQAVKSMLEA
ncbi:MAG: indole-3-glycerol phosphate synthase TrpC [Alphaproteobacteria bacterium]